jgi:hypothetical protein
MHRPSLWLSILAIALFSLIAKLAGASEFVEAPRTSPACKYFILEALDHKTTGAIRCRFYPNDSDVQITYSHDSRAAMLRVPSPRRLPIAVTVTRDGKEVTDLIEIEITKAGPSTPQPTPPPGPQPNPQPDQFTFAQKVTAEANKLPDHNRQAHAKQIAASLQGIRDRIAGGTLNASVKGAVLEAILHEVNTTWPSSWEPWRKWWGEHGQLEFERSGKMTPANWLDLLDSTIEGLKQSQVM